MTQASPHGFLDVPRLLERSAGRPRGAGLWYLAIVLLLVALISAAGSRAGGQGAVLEVLAGLLTFGLAGAMGFAMWRMARSAQGEQRQLEAVEELMQLRRWGESAALLEGVLSRPMRTPQARFQGLVFLAAVLARYHRFGDAVQVYDHLMDVYPVDGEVSLGLRLGRAMAMLHDDRLFDVDRAINELRRAEGAGESGGLALLEIYRDVKTGHPQEAIELFDRRRDVMRRQLGHRFGDALALAARAHDLAGDEAQARSLYADATTLTPEEELQRRYPELAPLAGRYPARGFPAEAA